MIYFNTKKEAFGYMIPDFTCCIDEQIWIHHSTNQVGTSWDIVNDQFVDLTYIPEYQIIKRLKQIEIELKNEDLIFAQKGEVIKEYNGKPYKIRYANDYQTLVLPSFIDDIEAKDIWDATELEFRPMTKAEVQALYEFLKPDYEVAFQDRKTNRAKLLKEKAELQNGGMRND